MDELVPSFVCCRRFQAVPGQPDFKYAFPSYAYLFSFNPPPAVVVPAAAPALAAPVPQQLPGPAPLAALPPPILM